MVAAVRRGASRRAVARRFGVSVSNVQRWVERADGQRLDRVAWRDRPAGCPRAANRVSRRTEAAVLQLRRTLREESVLGEYGANAIRDALAEAGQAPLPSVRTIGRILERRGALDGTRRQRWPAPPKGWYLPPVAAGWAELDCFDLIEDLKLKDGPLIDICTAIALHSGLVGAWPLRHSTAGAVLTQVIGHWRANGLPTYAQFDNDTRFQGPHQHRDVLGRVVRACLQLGVTPVFAPPREWGFQGLIEHFNGLFQAKVWQRVAFRDVGELARYAVRYCQARYARLGSRVETAPPRRPVAADWELDLGRAPTGEVIFIRRTSDRGRVEFLGRSWTVSSRWCHRLVRATLDLAHHEIRIHALRRRAPREQPLLAQLPYHFPHRPFKH